MTRVLIMDCSSARNHAQFNKVSQEPMEKIWLEMFRAADSAVEVSIINLGENDSYSTFPSPDELIKFCGVLIPGSPMSVVSENPLLDTHLECLDAITQAGLPVFGICYGLQLAAVLGGGEVKQNAAGFEFPVANNIRVSSPGDIMFEGRDNLFQAFSDHRDVVVTLPPGGAVLASNEKAPIQAARFRVNNSEVWGVQYHPDFTWRIAFHLVQERRENLTSYGVVENEQDADQYLSDVENAWDTGEVRFKDNPFGFTSFVLDEAQRTIEVKNWLSYLRSGMKNSRI